MPQKVQSDPKKRLRNKEFLRQLRVLKRHVFLLNVHPIDFSGLRPLLNPAAAKSIATSSDKHIKTQKLCGAERNEAP